MPANLDYLMKHQTPRFQRGSAGELLRRFLTFFGEQLGRFDQDFNTLYEKVRAETSPEGFIEFWCWDFFGWGWFPEWFTLERKQAFYGQLAQHLARRGTRVGIEGFLAAFGVHARVFNRPEYWEEFYWEEAYFSPDSGTVEQADVEALLRFQAPLGQDIYIEYLTV